MKRKGKILLYVSLTIFTILVGAIMLLFLSNKAKLNATTIGAITTKDLTDRVYSGSYEIMPVKVSVEVTITNKLIKDIKITEHTYGLGKKAESIIDDVINMQSLQVDVVSGATTSSKSILKAIENAIKK